jgi:plastocyanin
MKIALEILSPSLDSSSNIADARTEWCISAAAVDPITTSIFADNSDGYFYRWNVLTNTLSERIQTVQSPSVEAYAPTAIGPDGTVYALSMGNLSNVFCPSGGIIPTFAIAAPKTVAPVQTTSVTVPTTATTTDLGTTTVTATTTTVAATTTVTATTTTNPTTVITTATTTDLATTTIPTTNPTSTSVITTATTTDLATTTVAVTTTTNPTTSVATTSTTNPATTTTNPTTSVAITTTTNPRTTLANTTVTATATTTDGATTTVAATTTTNTTSVASTSATNATTTTTNPTTTIAMTTRTGNTSAATATTEATTSPSTTATLTTSTTATTTQGPTSSPSNCFTRVVNLSGVSFSPSQVTVQRGDVVQFVWLSGFHNVINSVSPGSCDVASSPLFDSGDAISTVGTKFNVSITFVDGDYPYSCLVHCVQLMGGSINVRGACPGYTGVNPTTSLSTSGSTVIDTSTSGAITATTTALTTATTARTTTTSGATVSSTVPATTTVPITTTTGVLQTTTATSVGQTTTTATQPSLTTLTGATTSTTLAPTTTTPSSYQFVVSLLGGRFELQWSIVDDTFFGQISCSATSGWIGLGLNGNIFSDPLNSGDWIVGSAVNSSQSFDQFKSSSSVGPVADTLIGGVDNVRGDLFTNNGNLVLRFVRAVNTQDSYDQVISNIANTAISAVCSNDASVVFGGRSSSSSVHVVRNTLTQFSSVTINFGTGLVTVFNNTMILVHAILMAVAFGVAFAVGIAIGRYVPRRLVFWFYLHVGASVLGLALVVAGFAVIVSAVAQSGTPQWSLSTPSKGAHAVLGIIALVWVILQAALGAFTKLNWDAQFRKCAAIPEPQFFPDKVHWISGYALPVIGFVNVFLGLYDWGVNPLWMLLWGKKKNRKKKTFFLF